MTAQSELTPTEYPHVAVLQGGEPILVEPWTKVKYVVIDTRDGLTPEQIQYDRPHLSLAHIYSALAYYHDHKEEMDHMLEVEEHAAQQVRAQIDGTSQLRERLRAKGLHT